MSLVESGFETLFSWQQKMSSEAGISRSIFTRMQARNQEFFRAEEFSSN